ncbi:hypothetical protein PG995_013725 [Apiospora arundinis]|uniref:Asx homology domain-containing protein n=1 Tax=Apiospora arundinis TaxID=335852 RepID=A0ABR2I1D9_9PEZI
MPVQYGGPEFFGQAPTPPPRGVAKVAATTKRVFRSLRNSVTKPINSCIMPSRPRRRAASAAAPAASPDNVEQISEQINDILDPKSAITNAENVHRAVANPYYWSKLSEEDRSRILNLWPDQKAVIYAGTPKAVLDFDVVKVNRDLRVNCRQYSADHAAGRHEPEWLAAAERAHVLRAEGVYEDMRRAHVERQFGVPMPGKDKGKAKMIQEEDESQQQQNGDDTTASIACSEHAVSAAKAMVIQYAGSASKIVIAQNADKDGHKAAKDQSDSMNPEDEVVVQPNVAEQDATKDASIQHETAVQHEPVSQQEPTAQQDVAVQEGVTAANTAVESEQTPSTDQVANAESDKGKKAEDVTPETSPMSRSGVLRRSKRHTSRSNPISRSSSG